MKKILLVVTFSLFMNIVYSQTVYDAIDTTDIEIAERIKFIRSYYNQETDYKEFWHPKYKNYNSCNFSELVDGISRNLSPKRIRDRFNTQITELQLLNDSLSYFKIFISDKSDPHLVEYKYYLVKLNGKYYLDNCKEYEKYRFNSYKTQYITFYTSPWIKADTIKMVEASNALSELYSKLTPDKPLQNITNFVCSSVEEMNILTNMTHYYGYVGGFAQMDDNFIVSHNGPYDYIHEFIHILLGNTAGGSFFLGEGVASYYGGLSYKTSYKEGLRYLKGCFAEKRCTFDLLLAKKIYNQRDNTPGYAFAALICDFIINNYGYSYFMSLYNNPEVTDANLLNIVSADNQITVEDVLNNLIKIIEDNE